MFIIILMLSSLAHGRQWKNDKIQMSFKKEKVQEPLCEEIVGYRYAALPNFFLQQNQAQILDDRFFQAFGLLESTGCSKLVMPLACSLYLPPWNWIGVAIPPCRDVCQKVKQECSYYLEYASEEEIRKLKCSLLPEPRKEIKCLQWDCSDFGPCKMKILGNATKIPENYFALFPSGKSG